MTGIYSLTILEAESPRSRLAGLVPPQASLLCMEMAALGRAHTVVPLWLPASSSPLPIRTPVRLG